MGRDRPLALRCQPCRGRAPVSWTASRTRDGAFAGGVMERSRFYRKRRDLFDEHVETVKTTLPGLPPALRERGRPPPPLPAVRQQGGGEEPLSGVTVDKVRQQRTIPCSQRTGILYHDQRLGNGDALEAWRFAASEGSGNLYHFASSRSAVPVASERRRWPRYAVIRLSEFPVCSVRLGVEPQP